MYNKNFRDEQDVDDFAKRLVGKSFGEAWQESPYNIKRDDTRGSGLHNKGAEGNYLEAIFGKPCDSNPERDVMTRSGQSSELKAVPVYRTKLGNVSFRQRLTVSEINYNEILRTDFRHSHAYHKLQDMIIVFYHRVKGLSAKDEQIVKVVTFHIDKHPEFLHKMERDWKTIQQFVKQGRAQDIHENRSIFPLIDPFEKAENKQDTESQPYSKIRVVRRAVAFRSGTTGKYFYGKNPKYQITKTLASIPVKQMPKKVKSKSFGHKKRYYQMCLNLGIN